MFLKRLFDITCSLAALMFFAMPMLFVTLLAKVEFDKYYLLHRSMAFDLKIIFLTVLKVVRREGVVH